MDENKQIFKDEVKQDIIWETKKIIKNELSSKKYLFLALLYTLSVIVAIVQFVIKLTFENFMNLIIPIILLFGVWGIYKAMSEYGNYTTSSIRLIKGVVSFLSFMLLIALGLMILGILLSQQSPLILLFFLILILLIFYGLYCFRKVLEHLIETVEEGRRNTEHYLSASNLIIIGNISSIIAIFVFIWVASGNYEFANLFREAILENLGVEQLNMQYIIIFILLFSINFLYSFYLAYFIRHIYKTLKNIDKTLFDKVNHETYKLPNIVD